MHLAKSDTRNEQRYREPHRVVSIAILLAALPVHAMGAPPDRPMGPQRAPGENDQPQMYDDAEAVSRARDVWRRIVAFEPVGGDATAGESADYWRAVEGAALREFYEFVKEGPPKAAFQEFVRQFGRHGPEADLRWLLAVRGVGCKPDFEIAPYSSEEFPGTEYPAVPQVQRAQLLMAELETRAFLKDPSLLRRHYHAVLWFGDFFDPQSLPDHVSTTRTNLKQGDDEYWWHARAFVLLAHATGRDDLVRDFDPDALQAPFDKWYAWFEKEGIYLRPSTSEPIWVLDQGERKRQDAYLPFVLKPFTLPSLQVAPEGPLPDWKGPAPAALRNVRVRFSTRIPRVWWRQRIAREPGEAR